MATSDTQKTPTTLLLASVIYFLAGTLFVLAFASPNWFEKGDGIASTFVKMGLWEVCFDGFQHPRYQLQRPIEGCNWLFSLEYTLILQDYLEPDWFITVQIFTSFAFLITLSGLIILAGVILNCCMYNMPYWLLIMASLSGVSGVLNFLSACIYGARADDREWLPDAQWHHLGWSYALFVLAMMGQLLTTGLFLLERRRAKRNPPPMPQAKQDLPMQPPQRPAQRTGQQPSDRPRQYIYSSPRRPQPHQQSTNSAV